MSSLNPLTAPRLVRGEGVAIDAAVAEPSVCFVEAGDSFGFLLSESAFDTSLGDALHLERVLWIRCAPRSGFLSTIFRRRGMNAAPFVDVVLYRHPSGLFVAQDTESHRYFPYPSEDPYTVIFITPEQYDELRFQAESEEMDLLLDAVRAMLDATPEFFFDGWRLDGPAGKAESEHGGLDQEVMQGE